MAIFSIKYQNEHKIFNICGIKIKLSNNIFSKIDKQFARNKNFDCRKFDELIAKKTYRLLKWHKFKRIEINNKNIVILATEFYDMGGHTECVKNLVSLLSDNYNITTFLTRMDNTYIFAPEKIKIIEQYSKICGLHNCKKGNITQNLIEIFNQINEFSPKVLFVYMHMDDSFSAALLYLIKKYTDIKIVYYNHGTHYPALGMIFADVVSYSFDSILKVNKEWRKIDNNVYLNLIDNRKEDIIDITEDRKTEIRKQLGIKENNYFTLSGATSYKFFNGNISPYFEMIKRLLKREPKLQHIVITKLSDEEKEIVDNIFKDSNTKDRLKIIDFTPNYSEIFQSCDLFIDSFPVASALTHVELMKHKKVSVVYKNNDNILYNFYEYFPKDYEYIFSDTKEMEDAILKLLNNHGLINNLSQKLYKHYLDTFEGSMSIKQYVKLIEGKK